MVAGPVGPPLYRALTASMMRKGPRGEQDRWSPLGEQRGEVQAEGEEWSGITASLAPKSQGVDLSCEGGGEMSRTRDSMFVCCYAETGF